MYIVQIASELSPIAKAGGLGDVVHGLSKELCKLGHQIEIILPKYDCIDYTSLKSLKVEYKELCSFDGPQSINNTIWSASFDNLKIWLIEPHHHSQFFTRGTIYGAYDDIDRFAYFSRTAVEFLYKSGRKPDVLHCHDWPAAIIPVLLKEMYAQLGFKCGGSLLTIHNLEHQGKCSPHNLTRIGLRGEDYLSKEKLQDPSNPELINLLKGGIIYADRISTVSPSYEKEIQTPQEGFGLNEVLGKYRHKLKGILNGIDESYWDPAHDKHLVKHYNTHQINSSKKLENVLEAKKANRRHLRMHLNLKDENRPIVATVTRLVQQKAPDLIEHALYRTLEKGGQFILLGSSATPQTQKKFSDLLHKMQGNENAALLLAHDEALAHLIFAAADMFIIPSLFEPCGLTQLIALRYGSVPIARMTGGLIDTVFDIDTSTRPATERNGFTFDQPNPAGVNSALDRALKCWSEEKEKWQNIMRQGMAWDFSWRHAAPEYLLLYRKM